MKLIEKIALEGMPNREYHNRQHTEEVRKEVIRLSNFTFVEEFKLQTAASFHDTGYIEGQENHEKRSAHIAERVMSAFGYNDRYIEDIKNIILSTEFLSKPQSDLGAFLADADVASFGKPFQEFWNDRMAVKQEMFEDVPMDEWEKMSIELLEKHEYHTKAAKDRYAKQKQENLRQLKERN